MNKSSLCSYCGTSNRQPQQLCYECFEPLSKPKPPSRSPWTRNLLSATLLFLLALLSGCVSGSPVLPNPYVPCDHPRVSVATVEGLTQGLLDYADSVDLCNALNGHPLDKDTK